MSLNDQIFRLTLLKQRVTRELRHSAKTSIDPFRALRLLRLKERLRARLSALLSHRLHAGRPHPCV